MATCYIHNHKENVPFARDDASHRDAAALLPAARSDDKSHLPCLESSQTAGMAPSVSPDGSRPVAQGWRCDGGLSVCFGVFYVPALAVPFLQPTVLCCMEILKYPFPSPLALSFTL